jgi:hypothetical protein
VVDIDILNEELTQVVERAEYLEARIEQILDGNTEALQEIIDDTCLKIQNCEGCLGLKCMDCPLRNVITWVNFVESNQQI